MKNKLKDKTGIRLDLGGGDNPQPGFVNMDYRPLKEVDIVHNLEKFPYPLKDESVLVITASHVLEHIQKANGIMLNLFNECWRVLKPGGEFLISCPYATSPGFYRDPTHTSPITEELFTYFDPNDPFYGGQLYRVYRPLPWMIKPGTLSWNDTGNLEVVLIKRPILKEYGVSKETMKFLKKGKIK